MLGERWGARGGDTPSVTFEKKKAVEGGEGVGVGNQRNLMI